MIIELEASFFRYDLQSPPEDWDDKFFNDEYDYSKSGKKIKLVFSFLQIRLKLPKNWVKMQL
ncbi:MAG: hypothetical protein ACQEWG_16670 [Bacteroidota bacterium]